ncbi:MAG: class I adenylate-forming enzyme family protein [Novosphingobium sp.]|nr:class I adenylate-forming enzyme family protein [Novosphingobium sp.]
MSETGSEDLAHWQPETGLAYPRESIGELLRLQARRFGDRPAVLIPHDRDDIETITYRELLERAENVARWLAGRCEAGSRIAIWSRNAMESVLIQYGCALSGNIVVMFNTAWTDSEVEHSLVLVSPAMVFAGCDNGGNDLGERARAQPGCPVLDLSDIDDIAGKASDHPLPDVPQDAPYLIQFTSGTTGKAKGALLSHRAALLGGWIRPAMDGSNETAVWLNSVPFHHVGGSCAIVMGALSIGSAFTLLERYDRDQLIRLMTKLKATRMGGVPTMWHDILASPELPDETSLKFITLGGASVPPAMVKSVRERLGASCGIGYGQSEAPVATATAPGDPPELICETVGRPSPHVELRIVDASRGETLCRGETGEICLRGPIIMDRYWNNPEATAATIDADGFLHTGDLGAMDEAGYVRIKGRLREVIIRGGENIYPSEIEDALLAHPAVAVAAVVGVDHERLGQEPGAVIQLRPDASVSGAELEEHLSTRVARFKIPRHWQFVDTVPLTASGKIRKIELEALFRQT